MVKRSDKIVIALGGNSLIKKGEEPSLHNHLKNLKPALKHLITIIKENKVILTHGSGPQVGALLIQNKLSQSKVPRMPLDVLDAEIQGGLGYIIEQTLQNLLNKHKIQRPVVSLLTQVIVDNKDPSFKKPIKPVGSFLNKKQAQELKKQGFQVVEQKGRGYRRVVPSPLPKEIDDIKTIEYLFNKNTILIAGGGGGIPVIKKNGQLKGVQGVIDKDLTSACIANAIKASKLIILMKNPHACLNYAKPNQQPIGKINIKQAQTYLNQGQFPPGSMGPKIKASINFLKKGGKQVIITNASNLQKALKGKAGTIITLR